MFYFKKIAIFLMVFTLWSNGIAHAGPKPWRWGWYPGHWENLDFEKPHLNAPKIPHNDRWNKDAWTPDIWIENSGGAEALLKDLYRARIITEQYVDDDIPVLEVGQGFITLSAEDQRRVAMFIDHMFGVTKSADGGLFYLYHYKTEEPIGLYTKRGLQLQ